MVQTKEETKPSRELDARAAEMVMGLKVRFERGIEVGWEGKPNGARGRAIMWSPNDYIVCHEDGTPEHANYLHARMHSYRIVPKYSTDIWAAWEVVESLYRRDFDCDLEVYKNKEGEMYHRVRFARFNHQEDVYVAFAPSMPLAICLAALKAAEADRAVLNKE
jgi:hypothetical protein